jgi:LAO/AO transport system kinase
MLQIKSEQDIDLLVAELLQGRRGALAKALRLIDDEPVLGRQIAFKLHDGGQGAKILGITGNPGAGKSTVVDTLIAHCRSIGKTVAVLAIDPSSPFSGGAILGDRIRMNRHTLDDGVYIRSLATRGNLGGLSRSTFDSVRVLDAAGYDVILVETVGTGQDEVDIVRLADTTVLVMVPGMGDDIQAIKAGILEIADIFLINKADRDGVPDLERSLHTMLSLAPNPSSWEPQILKSVATQGQGIVELWASIVEHSGYLKSEEGAEIRRQRAFEIFERLLDALLIEKGRERLSFDLDQMRQKFLREDLNPYAEIYNLAQTY